MCQQRSVYLCKHTIYRKIPCSAKPSQRSGCFFFTTPPKYCNAVLSQPSTQPCPNCLCKDRELWALQKAKLQQRREEATSYSIDMQELNVRLPRLPQPVRLRSEPEHSDTDMPRRNRTLTTVPQGIDLGSVAGDTFHFVHNVPTQQPSHLTLNSSSRYQRSQPATLQRAGTSQYVDTTQFGRGDGSVSPVQSGFADPQLVSPQTSLEILRAEASRRVVDGLGNFF